MGIQLSGLASGLDTQSLIKQLMQLEEIPLNKLKTQQQIEKWRKDMINDFKNKLLDLQSKASALTLSSAFTVKKTTTSDPTIVTATANTSAANGNYNINVTSLATATKYIGTAAVPFNAGSAAVLTSTAEMNTTPGIDVNPNAKFNDTVSPPQFDSGSVTAGYFYINNIRIDVAANDTINTVINKINSNSLTGVTASIAGDKITLKQNTIGATPGISITGDTSGFVTATKLNGVTTPGTDYGYTSKMNSSGVAFTSGTFTINGYTFSVDTANESAQDIVNKINNASAAGVTAFFDTNTNTLTITNSNTGNKDIVWGSPYDTSNFLSAMKIDTTGATGRTMGTNATVNINGASITRTSNTIDYNNTTFTLLKNGVANVTVSTDTDNIISKIKDFVNSYNAAVDYINGKLNEKTVQNPSTVADQQMGILNNDYLLRQTLTTMRNNIMNTVNGLPVNYNQLALIGITTGTTAAATSTTTLDGSDAKLVIDENKLKAALAADPTSVQNLFNKGTGSVTNEVLAGVDGVKTVFTLANKNLSTTTPPTITDSTSTVWTYVTGTPTAGTNQFTVDATNGTITFGKAPTAGSTIKVSYNYYSSGGSDAGVAIRIKSQLESLTMFQGMIDNRIGSSGSLTKEISYMDNQIKNMQDQLDMREELLNRQFTAMETALGTLKNQGSWLTSQLSSLPSSMR